MFYCIACKQLHPSEPREYLHIFKTGFHILTSVRYPAGLCQSEARELAGAAAPNFDGKPNGVDKHAKPHDYAENKV
ncbi:hypothetical protein SAMN02799630_01450 [Paenibacillus sp. UNCCL117]|uniref:DUF3973 domain-containing protein n=1 Tax=unclassified Paenibacillus TaxID=185978 RepID=UPI00088E8107|nr:MULTISPECIES: DUF3973 domain-containing protein [unclassified Paenibacillus]SDC77484.1 hypothetical protein SAMN04488602_103429 [Paenibacillus sp. cl123]SFW25834.1 hypothetical protein SAMN02799630_01450 [Paenibacillus sp. UNCCL117]